jgi:DNA-binding beta-propeller fold protein YncE
VSRIDPETNEVVAAIDVGSAPSGIAAGLGYVWVTAQAPPAT